MVIYTFWAGSVEGLTVDVTLKARDYEHARERLNQKMALNMLNSTKVVLKTTLKGE